jgi:hypothetical protein
MQHRIKRSDLLHRSSSLRSWSHRSGALDGRGAEATKTELPGPRLDARPDRPGAPAPSARAETAALVAAELGATQGVAQLALRRVPLSARTRQAAARGLVLVASPQELGADLVEGRLTCSRYLASSIATPSASSGLTCSRPVEPGGQELPLRIFAILFHTRNTEHAPVCMVDRAPRSAAGTLGRGIG